MVFKIINDLAPSYLSDILENKIQPEAYTLRSSSANLKIPKVRTEMYKKGFAYTATELWNSLPETLKMEGSLARFKKQIKKCKFSCENSL